MLYLCRACGRHPPDDVPVHWDAEEGRPPGVGLQGVPAAVRHDIQVQGQRKANQLHLLPGQENAGGAILVMVEKELLVLCMEFMILNSIAHFKNLVSSIASSSETVMECYLFTLFYLFSCLLNIKRRVFFVKDHVSLCIRKHFVNFNSLWYQCSLLLELELPSSLRFYVEI